MKIKHLKYNRRYFPPNRHAGMTLIEVVVALAITGLTVGGIVNGYVYCTTSAQKAALSLAANARALERIEETRSAIWAPARALVADQLSATNFPDKDVILDLSGSGAGPTWAKIQTTITTINNAPPLRGIRVDCIWTFRGTRMTNTIETCRTSDQ